MSLAVYAYQDANRELKYVDELNFNSTGTWSSTGTYSVGDAANYGNSRYISIVFNVGATPTVVRPIRKWSPLVLVRAATAVSPPESSGSIPWSGTIGYDLQGPQYQTVSINGNTAIEVVGAAAGADMRSLIVNATGTNYLLSFNGSLVWHTAVPGTLPTNKSVLLDFTSFGTGTRNVHVMAWPQI